jgi:hypothetical protein
MKNLAFLFSLWNLNCFESRDKKLYICHDDTMMHMMHCQVFSVDECKDPSLHKKKSKHYV